MASSPILQRARPGRHPVALALVLLLGALAMLGSQQRPEFQDEYSRRLHATAAEDLPARYTLARWLYEQGAYELALQHAELLDARLSQQSDPDPSLVQQVRTLRLQAQQRVKEVAASQPSSQPSAAVALLTPEQIRVIRVWETDLRQHPRVIIPTQVLDEVFAKYADSPLVPKGPKLQREARAWPGWQQLELLFALRAREFYDRVDVLEEPKALQTFRQVIQPEYLMKSCASVNCHAIGKGALATGGASGGGASGGGASGGGGLTLYRATPTSDATAYTNFYILSQATAHEGRIIDRTDPVASLLVQYGLPRDQAQRPHPDVPGWRPALRGPRDPMYPKLIQWIGQELYQPQPDYDLTPTSQPAQTQPAPPPQAPAPAPPRQRY